MNLEATKKAYNEILKAMKKHKDICVFDIETLERQSNIHLYGLELKEKYGLDIDPKQVKSTSFNEFHGYCRLYKVGKDFNNSISWSDDGRQPDNELLLNIAFPTGAYIFGEDYPKVLFQKFFLELKSYNPKYTDSHNHCLYFSMDNAKDVFNNFVAIYKKYCEINKEDFKQRKIERMKADLAKLEGVAN